MYFIFEHELFMFATMGLSGGWCYYDKNKNKYMFSDVMEDYKKYISNEKMEAYKKNVLNHLNIEFKTKSGSLYFYDVLSFGTLKVINNIDELNKKLNQVGPDIMENETTFTIFKNKICLPKNLDKSIGVVLVDQKTISGIGNYLRSDILYASRINPFRKVKTISDNELRKIYINSKILTWGEYDKKKAIKLKIIKNGVKMPSDYDRLFYVYQQNYDIYGNKIIKKELYEGSQKRFIYYVPKLQK